MPKPRGSLIPAQSVERFLAALAAGDSVCEACRASCIGRTTVYALRVVDDEFAARWDAATERLCEGIAA